MICNQEQLNKFIKQSNILISLSSFHYIKTNSGVVVVVEVDVVVVIFLVVIFSVVG